MNSDPPTDKTGYAVRFGCGAIFGILFVGFGIFNLFAEDVPFLVWVIVPISGLLAVRFGDQFWNWVSWWVR